MKCHFCGKEVWLVRHLLDGDFCSPAHRKKYHERLRRSLESLPRQDGPPGPVAGFQFEMPPADSCSSARRSAGFQSTRPGPYPPKYALALAPRLGQTFFEPNLATAAAPPATHSLALLEPVTAAPRAGMLGRGWTLAGGDAFSSAQQWMALGPVAVESGAPALPVCSTPAALGMGAGQMICPKLALGDLFGDGLTGDTAGPVDLRHVPLAAWTRTVLEPIRNAIQTRAAAEPLQPARAAASTQSGLRLTPCTPAPFSSPLLAEDTVAGGKTAAAAVETVPVAQRTAAILPAIGAAGRAQLAPEPNALWNISAASPWNLVQPAAPERLAAAPAATILPAMALAPVRPGLAAEWESRSLHAGPLEVAPAASQVAGRAIDARERPAVAPAIAVPAVPVVLPQAVHPRPFRADVVSPQEQTALPVAVPEMPMAPMSAHAPGMESCAAPAAWNGLRAAGPVAPAMPAFIPQAAAPRYAGELLASPCHTNTAVPAGTIAGFAWKPFAAVAPQAAEHSLQPVIPVPATVAGERISFRDPAIPVTGIGLLSLAADIPLDVYVQRIRCTPKRECAWQPLPVTVAQPSGLPGVSPARFEQLVLQDWRRRYPSRQVSLTPAPISTGTNVVPMARRLSALARLQRNAPHFFKAAAAALVLGAILWLSASTQSVRSFVAADRQWLKTAITKRAALVLDDNFHGGLNLWDGRKNWARSWSYSADGFMRTGQLALYRPTLKMDNYKLEFFAQIESKSVGWVFRAKDEQNYYAMKLSVTEPGPRPLVSVVRYPVLAGKKGKKVQIPLPIMMHNNTPYHVALDVKGARFRAFIEDQEVDSWTDDRLHAGGVGFFSETGEHARLYWVKVSNNTDWLGRLCGMLSGGGQNEAELWNPAGAGGSMAALDLSGVLAGAKNADRRRGAPMLPLAVIFRNSL